MPKSIIWSPQSESDLFSILQYLEHNWESQVTVKFLELTEALVNQLAANPKQFPIIYKRKGIRKCVLTKHNILYYREGRKSIDILRIYDSRQDPHKLKFP